MEATTNAAGVLVSELWIDQPDALNELEGRAAGAGLSLRETDEARRLINDGYAVLDLPLTDDHFRQIEMDIERLWTERPRDVAWGGTVDGIVGDFAFSDIPKEFTREDPKNYRFCRAHSHSTALTDLYHSPEIHRFISFLFGQPCVATQTLYFEYGSRQGLHRDTSVVSFGKLHHLFAAWIALEDISLECGPLTYIPGSHRTENFFFPDGSIILDASKYGPTATSDMHEGISESAGRNRLKVSHFLAKRGQALIWHHSLAHGGSPVIDESLTRKSLVVHFTSRETYQDMPHALHYKPEESSEYWRFQTTSTSMEDHGGRLGAGHAIVGWHQKRLPPSRPARSIVNTNLLSKFETVGDDVGAEHLSGRVDVSTPGKDCVILSGWAVNNSLARPSDHIVVTAGTKAVYVGNVDQPRPDVADAFELDTLTYAGFYVLVPSSMLQAHDGPIRVWAVSKEGEHKELEYHDGFNPRTLLD